MRSKFVVAVVAGLTLVLTTGCNSDAPPASSLSGSTTTTTQAPKSEISAPLNLNGFAANTCAGLTDAQVAPYVGTPRGKSQQSSSNGPVCAVLAQDYGGPSLGVGLANIATPTEELLYESAQNYPWRQKISPIQGYPAINAAQASNSQQGDCATNVAVNATQSLHIEFTQTNPSGQNYTTPCSVTNTLMADLLQNIKSGGS